MPAETVDPLQRLKTLLYETAKSFLFYFQRFVILIFLAFLAVILLLMFVF